MKNKKHLNQIVRTKTAINFLNEEIQALNDYEDIQKLLNEFNRYYSQQANENNNRANKALMGFIYFFDKVAPKERTAKKLTSKKSYKDYLGDYKILRERGHSFKSIADYSFKHFKIKVSKETVRTALKGFE